MVLMEYKSLHTLYNALAIEVRTTEVPNINKFYSWQVSVVVKYGRMWHIPHSSGELISSVIYNELPQFHQVELMPPPTFCPCFWNQNKLHATFSPLTQPAGE